MNPPHRRAIIHFVDHTSLALEWPKQELKGHLFLAEALRKAIEADRLMVEVEGSLLVIPMRNVKHIELSPVPEDLPDGVIRHARRVVPMASTALEPVPKP